MLGNPCYIYFTAHMFTMCIGFCLYVDLSHPALRLIGESVYKE